MRRLLNKVLPGCATALLVCATAAGQGLDEAAPSVTSQQVAAAIRKGVACLLAGQMPDGSWPRAGQQGGLTALNVLALLNAGVPASDPAVAKALQYVARTPDRETYTVGLKCQALAASGVKAYLPALQDSANWLIQAQLDTGMWTYRAGGGRGDNSNTQFALLGLHEAANAGLDVPKLVWTRASRHYLNTQLPDGGWVYFFIADNRARNAPGRATGSMTAAGLAGLYITGQELFTGGPKVFRNGAYPNCGKYQQNVKMAAGLDWLTRNFTVVQNPFGGAQWLHYYLYALERIGMLSGMRTFGSHDWYRTGAAFLVGGQRPDGGWGQLECDTAFALLFLAKGNRPVVFQKVQWHGQWNRNVNDLEHLTTFIGDKLGKPVTWQTASLNATVEELRQGPILWITGHEFPDFTPRETGKLRRFAETGGTLLFEACCGSQAYRDGFRKFAREVFPEYVLRPIGASDPILHSYYDLPDAYEMEGIDVGCRMGVIFSPSALSCLWELREYPDWSDKAFRIGTNIAAYATGKEPLADKLDVVVLPHEPNAAPAGAAEAPRGAVRIARLVHGGDYDADPHTLVNLEELLRDKANVKVVARGRQVRADDEPLYEYPLVFMSGHYAFEMSDREVEALRLYLQRGGFLLAEACCGRQAFDASFRKLAARLFPDRPLQPLPADHPLYAGQVGLALGELRYRQVLADELKSRGTTRPPLEAVTHEGRTAILYSPLDYSCALEGDHPYLCRGYVDEDGQRLAIDLVLYAITY